MIKIISFCTAKENIHKTKRTSEQEKIFANNVTTKGFSSKTNSSIIYTQTTQSKNVEYLNRHYPKIDRDGHKAH